MFIDFKPLHNECQSKSKLLCDMANHTTRWRQMLVTGSLSSSTHECSHSVSAELRNGKFEDGFTSGPLDIDVFNFPDAALIQPSMSYKDGPYFGKRNGFYLFNNKAILFNEPNLRKRDAVAYIPTNLRGSRFSTYITGQTAWDDTPLYIFDEWNAYCAGTECALELANMGDMSNKGTDVSSGPIEFLFYSLGLCTAIQEKTPSYFTEQPIFKQFVAYQMNRAIKASTECNKIFPWDSTTRLLEFYNSEEGKKWRDWAGPTPIPNKIDRTKFNLA